MKKILTLFSITFALAIFFYPTISNSNATGSPGGKTGSPTDAASCTGCHYAGNMIEAAIITTNIPSSGYVPNQVYTITANIIEGSVNKFGFEITAEEENFGSAKTGSFLVTNNTETQFTNNNTAITHKAGGTSGSNSKSWSMDWEAPNTGTGSVTFYGSFMAANSDGTNSGDNYKSATLTVNEGFSTTINDLSVKNDFTFNAAAKTIELIDNSELSVYNMEGKLILSSNKKHTSLSHLSKGIYIIKSENRNQKIILN